MFRKNLASLLVILGALVLVGSLGTLAASASAPAQAQDPVTVVQTYYDAYNNKDVDAAMENIAADAIFINPIGTFKGADEIRAHLQSIINDDLKFELSNFVNDNGRVTYGYEVIIGGETVETGTDGLTIVKDGKIVFDGTVGTEMQLPTTGMDPTTHTLLWVATGGLVLAGVGLVLVVRKRKQA